MSIIVVHLCWIEFTSWHVLPLNILVDWLPLLIPDHSIQLLKRLVWWWPSMYKIIDFSTLAACLVVSSSHIILWFGDLSLVEWKFRFTPLEHFI